MSHREEIALAAFIVGLAEMTSFILFCAMVVVWLAVVDFDRSAHRTDLQYSNTEQVR